MRPFLVAESEFFVRLRRLASAGCGFRAGLIFGSFLKGLRKFHIYGTVPLIVGFLLTTSPVIPTREPLCHV